MINVVCVQVGDYCGRGAEYVIKLITGISTHLNLPHRLWVITDYPQMFPHTETAINSVTPIEPDVGVKGWWNKCALFRPGIFPNGERVLYFDLDTIITGDLSDIAAYTGKFAALRDFNFKGNMNSGLMAWEAGTLDHIWRVWQRCGRPQFDPGGDQAWIEDMQPTADYWQEIMPGQVVSYKVDCQQGVPDKARVCCFHGHPRPHEVNWEIGGHNGN